MSWPVAILAGGLATRLRPLTDAVPKVLLPVAGRPFIFHQLELLQSLGVERVVLCVGHLGELIRSRVGRGLLGGVTVDYSFDGPELLGTAGALRKALPLLGEQFFVLYGDSYLRCSLNDVRAAYESAGCSGLMVVFRNEGRWDKSNATVTAAGLVQYDKCPSPAARAAQTHIDAGLSVLSSDALARAGHVAADATDDAARLYGEGSGDLAQVFRHLSRRGDLAAFEARERFYEIGSVPGLRDTEQYLSRTHGRSQCL